ncbi:MAG: tRNA (adenosine(37)-N6)-threonylcarbamoyltransferase complex transferase subunit TsaD [bacterium]|nr:tRNA (adenosine(37)-N6)-threonylcarbamoyltransferase complex transferase subunit TsaD [bacterium]
MRILSVETSCDETAIAIIDASGDLQKGAVYFTVLSNVILSQVKLHEKFGGVYPSLAKREHAKNLIPVFKQALKESNFLNTKNKKSAKSPSATIPVYWNSGDEKHNKIKTILEREPELLKQFLEFIPTIEKPPADAIAVTYGPGLEPALWVGINFAKTLSLVWNIPIIPVNHMEGHIFSAMLKKSQNNADLTRKGAEKNKSLHATPAPEQSSVRGTARYTLHDIQFPVLTLLISGGHTELVLMKKWLDYKIIGETQDDAAGEAFDKVARMLGLPYPGGPQIARLAQSAQKYAKQTQKNAKKKNSGLRKSALSLRDSASLHFPRPMINSGDYNFSFSGLKTAVLYLLKDLEKSKNSDVVRVSLREVCVSPRVQSLIAREFQEAVTDVLASKTIKAAKKYGVKTIVVGGGVSANKRIREQLKVATSYELQATSLLLSPLNLTGDNAFMIGVAGYIRTMLGKKYKKEIKAEGNLRLK